MGKMNLNVIRKAGENVGSFLNSVERSLIESPMAGTADPMVTSNSRGSVSRGGETSELNVHSKTLLGAECGGNDVPPDIRRSR